MRIELLLLPAKYFKSSVHASLPSLSSMSQLQLAYGNGAWPLLTVYEKGEIAANGNYLEPDSIAVRHGICGDPEQVSSYSGPSDIHEETSSRPTARSYERVAM